MSAINNEPFPRIALIAAAALVGVSLIATTAARLVRLNSPPAPVAAVPAPAAVADLRFFDEADGSVRVEAAATGALVGTVAPGSGGFVRGVMRGLARDRISRHIGASPPFRLSQTQAGALWLQDTATGRLIDLDSFGQQNREAFLALLPAKGTRS